MVQRESDPMAPKSRVILTGLSLALYGRMPWALLFFTLLTVGYLW